MPVGARPPSFRGCSTNRVARIRDRGLHRGGRAKRLRPAPGLLADLISCIGLTPFSRALVPVRAASRMSLSPRETRSIAGSIWRKLTRFRRGAGLLSTFLLYDSADRMAPFQKDFRKKSPVPAGDCNSSFQAHGSRIGVRRWRRVRGLPRTGSNPTEERKFSFQGSELAQGNHRK
jgi:hypothetical protein